MATKLSTIRNLHSDYARAYKYEFQVVKYPNVASTFRTQSKINDTLKSSCLTITLPNEGVQLIEVEIGIHTMKLHGRKEKGGTINPEFILSGDYSIYKWFREWANAASPDSMTSSEVQALSSDLLATINVVAKNIQNSTAIIVQLQNAWCRNAPEISFDDNSNDIVRWSPEIVYEFSSVIDGATLTALT